MNNPGCWLHCPSGSRDIKETWADSGWEACSQLHDGHTTDKKGKDTCLSHNKSNARESSIPIYLEYVALFSLATNVVVSLFSRVHILY